MNLRYRIIGSDKRSNFTVLYAFNRLIPARKALKILIKEGRLTGANFIWDALRCERRA